MSSSGATCTLSKRTKILQPGHWSLAVGIGAPPSRCFRLLLAEASIWVSEIVVDGWGLWHVRGSIPSIDVLLTNKIAELNAGAPAVGPAETWGQASFPKLVGLHVAHVSNKVNLFGQPGVQVAGANLQERRKRRSCSGARG